MKDKTQRVISYISGAGLTVYETEQYNAKTGKWYIVGDSTTSKKLAEVQVELHNKKIEL